MRILRPQAATSLAMLVLLLIGATSVGFGAPLEEGSFLIEDIEVQGATLLSERIVVAESRLEHGTSITETELQHAIRRIRRLPTVLTVDFKLTRGSQRGRYQLVIMITETSRAFFGLDLATLALDDLDFFPPAIPDVPGVDDGACIGRTCYGDDFEFAAAGIRHPIGSAGVAWAAVQARSSVGNLLALELGYTQRDVGGTAAFLSGRAAIGVENQPRWLTFEAGIPIAGNQSLRFLAHGFQEKEELSYPVGDQKVSANQRKRQLDLDLEWRFDSRDDLYFPTTGRLLSASLQYEHREEETPGRINFHLDEPIVVFETGSESLFTTLAGTWFHPLGRRDAMSWGATMRLGASDVRDRFYNGRETVGPIDFDSRTISIRAHAGYLRTLWRPTKSRNQSELQWQTSISGLYGQGQLDSGLPDFDWHEIAVGTSLSLRNRWGIFRVLLAYRNGGRGIR